MNTPYISISTEKTVYLYDPLWLPMYLFFYIFGSFPVVLVGYYVFHVTTLSGTLLACMLLAGTILGDKLFSRSFNRVMCLMPCLKVHVRSLFLWFGLVAVTAAGWQALV